MATQLANMTDSNASVVLSGKRKRNVVDYAMFDRMNIDEAIDMAEEVAENDDEDDTSDSDSPYGSRKAAKSNKKKRLSKKSTKLQPRKTKKDQKPFPFLALPAELRDYIYELALVQPGDLTMVSKTKSYRRTVNRGFVYENGQVVNTALIPNLLAVNKQIHSEGIGYLYKQPIILEDTMALHTFIAAIGSNKLQLTHIVVRGWGCGRGTHKAMNVAALTILAGCTNLRTLDLDCNIGWARTPKQLARQLYRDGHYFLEAYGAANGKKDAAINILKLGDGNYNTARNWGNTDGTKREKYEAMFQEEMRKLLGA